MQNILIWKGAGWSSVNAVYFETLLCYRQIKLYVICKAYVIWKTEFITSGLFPCWTHCLDLSKVLKVITTHTHIYINNTDNNTTTKHLNRDRKHVSLMKCGKKMTLFNNLPPYCLCASQGQKPVSCECSTIYFSPYTLSSSGYFLSNKCFNYHQNFEKPVNAIKLFLLGIFIYFFFR